MRIILLAITLGLFAFSTYSQTGYVQEGKASFYADKFEGRVTASGERYSHTKSTCAHLSLPFGTLVRVTNLANNLSVIVRVNDRGPFVPNRIIDLSRSAADKLNFLSDGSADVRIEAIDESGNVVPLAESQPKPTVQTKPVVTETSTKPTATTPAIATEVEKKPAVATSSSPTTDIELYGLNVTKQKPSGFTVQIGSYKELVNLLRIADDLKTSLKKEVRVQVATINNEKIYRLMVGEFTSRLEAENFKEKAAAIYPDCFIVELK
jgi:rare lipoprotein A